MQDQVDYPLRIYSSRNPKHVQFTRLSTRCQRRQETLPSCLARYLFYLSCVCSHFCNIVNIYLSCSHSYLEFPRLILHRFARQDHRRLFGSSISTSQYSDWCHKDVPHCRNTRYDRQLRRSMDDIPLISTAFIANQPNS